MKKLVLLFFLLFSFFFTLLITSLYQIYRVKIGYSGNCMFIYDKTNGYFYKNKLTGTYHIDNEILSNIYYKKLGNVKRCYFYGNDLNLKSSLLYIQNSIYCSLTNLLG